MGVPIRRTDPDMNRVPSDSSQVLPKSATGLVPVLFGHRATAGPPHGAVVAQR